MMDQQEIANVLVKYRPFIYSKLKQQYPSLPGHVVEDVFSESVLNILTTSDQVEDGKIVYTFLGYAYQEIFKVLKDRREFQVKVVQKRRHQNPIDFKDMDVRFSKFLTPLQRQLYDYRVKGVRVKDIRKETGKTINCVNVETFLIVKKYVKWKKRMEAYKIVNESSLCPYVRSILHDLSEGMTVSEIADKRHYRVMSVRSAMVQIHKLMQPC